LNGIIFYGTICRGVATNVYTSIKEGSI